jgi:hypothetical protein
MLGDVRFGSKADIGLPPVDVRCTPNNGHSQARLGCLLCAKSGDDRGWRAWCRGIETLTRSTDRNTPLAWLAVNLSTTSAAASRRRVREIQFRAPRKSAGLH